MEVLDRVEDMAVAATELPVNDWSNGMFEQEDSMNSKDQGLMLEEVREAMNDMAQLVSMYSASSELPEFAGGISQDEASSEKSPTLIGDESTANEEREATEMLMSLFADIEQAQTVDDLEKIHERFSARAQLLKGKIAMLKSRELVEAYLSLMASLKAVQRQIDAARQQNITQINGRQIAEQLSSRLMQSQQMIRQAAQRMMENAMKMAQQNMMSQAVQVQNAMRASMEQMMARSQQANQQAQQVQEHARLAMQQLAAKLAQSQKAMQMAQETMLRARTMQQQQQVIARLNQIMGSINLQSTIANVQRQLQAIQRQMQQQQQQARDAVTREQATRQSALTQQLQTQLSQLNIALQQQQAIHRAFEMQQSIQQITQMNSAIQQTAERMNFANVSRMQSENAIRLSHDAQTQVNSAIREKAALDVATDASRRPELAAERARQSGIDPAVQQGLKESQQQAQKEAQKAAEEARKAEAQKQQQTGKAAEEAKAAERAQRLDTARLAEFQKQSTQQAQNDVSRREKPKGDVSVCSDGCPCNSGCKTDVVKKIMEGIPVNQKTVDTTVNQLLGNKKIENLSVNEFNKVLASTSQNAAATSTLLNTQNPSEHPSIKAAQQALNNTNLNQGLF